MNSLNFVCLRGSLFLLKCNFSRYRILDWWIFSALNTVYITPLSYFLYCFWGEIAYNSYICTSVGKVFPPLSWLLSRFFIFYTLYRLYLDVVFVFCRGRGRGCCISSLICGLLSDINLGKILRCYCFKCFLLSFSSPSGIHVMHMLYFFSCPTVLGYFILFFSVFGLFDFLFFGSFCWHVP